MTSVPSACAGVSPRVATLLLLAAVGMGACQDPPPLPIGDLVPADAVVASDPAGKIGGSFSVTNAGHAAYAVPLQLPAGRAGMQPSLSIQYDSGAGNGLLGVGFTLAGLSSIRRCESTVAIDGVAAPIRFDDSDRLCLNGERLVRVVGRDEYRTERDPYERIVPLDSDARGPTRFRVFTRDGRILEYGGTPEARLEGIRRVAWRGAGHDRVRLAWALSRIEDRSGNYVSVEHARLVHQDGALEQVPLRLRYTGQSAGAAPQRYVELLWERRPDPWDGYVAGLRLRTAQRLRRIEAWAPNGRLGIGLMRAWGLEYRNDSATSRSLLSEIRECDGAGVCKPPTTFRWSLGSLDHAQIETGISDVATDARTSWTMSVADLDGDGTTELFYPVAIPDSVRRFEWYVRRPTPLGGFADPSPAWTPPTGTHGVFGPSGPARLFDFDGDGDAELLANRMREIQPYRFAWQTEVWDWTGTTFTRLDEGSEIWSLTGPGNPRIADLDGNGARDHIREDASPAGRPVWVARFHDGQAWDRNREVGGGSDRWDEAQAIDVDDDGATEILEPVGDDEHVAAFIRSDRATRDQFLDLEPSRCRLWADVNGDGLADSLVMEGGAPKIRLNTGRGFVPSTTSAVEDTTIESTAFDACPHPPAETPPGIIPTWRHPLHVLDFDGDGRDDILDVSIMAVLLARGFRETHFGSGTFATFQFELRTLPYAPAGEPGKPPTVIGWPNAAIGDIDGNGLPDIIHIRRRVRYPEDAIPQLTVLRRNGSLPDLVTGITDGFGAQVTVDHAPLGAAGTYSPGSGCTYPVRCVRGGAQPVVAAHEESDGIGGMHRYIYRYQDARVDIAGRGWLGFGRRTVIHRETGAVTETEYGDRRRVGGFYPFANTVAAETSSVRDPVTGTLHVSRVRNVFVHRRLLGGSAYTTELAGRARERFEVTDGRLDTEAPLRRWTSVYEHDSWGNVTLAQTRSASGRVERVQTEYDNRERSWLLGLPRRVQSTSEMQGCSSGDCTSTVVREYRFDSLGRLVREDLEPDDPEAHAFTTYVRGSDGVVDLVRAQAEGLDSRATHFAWDAERLYPREVTNAAGHVTRFLVHPGLGVAVAAMDPNGVTTRLRVDGFGRRREQLFPDGRRIEYRYLAARIEVESGAGATALRRHDVLGRPLRDQWTDGEGRTVVVDREWDRLGRVRRVTRPRFEPLDTDETPVWLEVERDILGRLTRVPSARGDGYSTIRYAGLETIVTDPRGSIRARVEDPDGRTVEIDEPRPAGGRLATRYEYGAGARLQRIIDPQGNLTDYRWDALGRLRLQSSLDTGVRRAWYDGFGDVRQLQTEVGLTTFVRDRLGRPTSITSPDGTTTLEWDIAEHGIGSLANGESPDGVFTEHVYDLLGRAQSTAWTIPTGDGDSRTLDVGVAYDSEGNVARIDYPDADGAHPFSVLRSHDARGLLTAVHEGRADGTRGDLLWSAGARDAEDRVVEELFGNGVSTRRAFDPVSGFLEHVVTRGPSLGGLPKPHIDDLGLGYDPNGHVELVEEPLAGRREHFAYDALDRLREARVEGEDARHFAYDDIGNLDLHEGVTQRYGERGMGPHALGSAGERAYDWDSAGRNTDAPDRRIEWTSFDLPRTTWLGPNAARTDYQYDPWQQRVRKAGPDGAEVLYAGGLYERRTVDGTTTHVWLVPGNDQVVAQVAWTEGSSADEVRYLHRDQVGSVRLATDEAGEVVHRARYRPFGQRIVEPDAVDGDITRGFGGHEEDDSEELLNLGGRLYDPSIGRFLSPDPIQASPFATAALDPYAYVYNDPLTLTDPTGFQAEPDNLPTEAWDCSEGSCQRAIVVYGHDPAQQATDPEVPGAAATATEPTLGGAFEPGTSEPGVFDFGLALDLPPVGPSGNVLGPSPGNTLRSTNGLTWSDAVYSFAIGSGGQALADLWAGFGDGFFWAAAIAASPALLMGGLALYAATGASPFTAFPEVSGTAIDDDSGYYIAGNVLGDVVFGLAAGALTAAPFSAARGGTGAFLEGAQGGAGLGRLAGRSIQVSERGLAIVESHLAQFGSVPENAAMVARLRQTLAGGSRISGADASFYLHELSEATMMGRGLSYEAAHAAALAKYGVSPFSVYAPEVIAANPGAFNSTWFAFWGLSR